ncbi:ATP-dependent Clp protease adaptor ClpS [Membranicola marinus]|uniref:ATP-dependent Clp protease adaptor ClpS n=1 Tax=Membranihabitans marinus TaxID=1227546 RepID=A0A953HPA0_9BACT|nr:ATP-dependent Clp protease adaptor ClpS [Membranihabitans marinus]MBY5958298.1 ATP-dependent Clp protease adaptor ClpS [Membranihabitans marinus]
MKITDQQNHPWKTHYVLYTNSSTSTEEEELVLVDEEIDEGSPAELVVYNDDYNTFDHVIECFVQILKHSEVQAEQLSLMIHFNGKAIVKTAPFKVLKPYKDALVERGLSAVIEQ